MAKGKPASKGAFKKGYDPRRNLTTPGPGRPPEAYIQELRGILHDPAVLARLRRYLATSSGCDDELFVKVWDKVHDKLHPKQVELSGDPERPLYHTDAAAELARRLDRLAARSQPTTSPA